MAATAVAACTEEGSGVVTRTKQVREPAATAWLDEIVRELGVVSIGTAVLPKGDGFEASIDVPELGDYAVGFGMTTQAAVLEAAEHARNKDVRK